MAAECLNSLEQRTNQPVDRHQATVVVRDDEGEEISLQRLLDKLKHHSSNAENDQVWATVIERERNDESCNMVARQLHAATNSDSRSARTKIPSQRLKTLNAERIRLDERFKSSIADKDNFSRTSREVLHHRRSIAYAKYEDFLMYQSPRFRGKRFRRLLESNARGMESMATNEPDILASSTTPTPWLRAVLDGFDTASVGQPPDSATDTDPHQVFYHKNKANIPWQESHPWQPVPKSTSKSINEDLTNHKRLEIEQNAGDNRTPDGNGYATHDLRRQAEVGAEQRGEICLTRGEGFASRLDSGLFVSLLESSNDYEVSSVRDEDYTSPSGPYTHSLSRYGPSPQTGVDAEPLRDENIVHTRPSRIVKLRYLRSQ